MRLGVLDIGSNTGHLLVVDAYWGAAPVPASSFKESLRLAEHLDEEGHVTAVGVAALIEFVGAALRVAETKGCEEIYGFATSAVRAAQNSDEVLEAVRAATGAHLEVLPGEDEARLTFLAVRRWFGWSSGRMVVFDIGGGSLEIAAGIDEAPDTARSLPLGAGRLARAHFRNGIPDEDTLATLRRQLRTALAREAGDVLRFGAPDRAVATSKTFRSLARICGAAPSADGQFVRRTLAAADLQEWIPKLLEMAPEQLAQLPGVSPDRVHQIVPGALVAAAVTDVFGIAELEICPWALREGVILDRLDRMNPVG